MEESSLTNKHVQVDSLVGELNSRSIDWRFPNQWGLSERTLDCRQLSVMEVLLWKREQRLIEVFIDNFDCRQKGFSLVRKEATLQLGWDICKYQTKPSQDIKQLINFMLRHEGHCLLYYNAYTAPFSSYYGIQDVTHWSLVVDSNNYEITLVDLAGSLDLFKGNTGKISWEQLIEFWNTSTQNKGMALVQYLESSSSWEDRFETILKRSVWEMLDNKGLQAFKQFITNIQQCLLEDLVKDLEKLEFNIHFYRRLRELWLLAVNRSVIPEKFLFYGWVEELLDLCKYWSLVMGVIMKWKRQPDKDYRIKLVDYLWEVNERENRFFAELKRTGDKNEK